MKWLFLLSVFFTHSIVCNAQIQFNKNHLVDMDSLVLQPLCYSWGTSMTDIEKDTIKLVASGASGVVTGGVKSYLFNIYNDSTFHLIKRLDGGNVEYTSIQNSLYNINDSVYAMACVYDYYNFVTNQIDTLKSGLIYFNKAGDTLYTRWFGENKRFIIRGFERIDDNLFLMGVTEFIGDGTKSYIVKTDLWGNLIWEKMLTQYTTAYNNVIDIAKVGNKGYLLTGVHNSNASGNNGGLYRIDTNGNIIWHKNLYNNANNGCYNIREDADGTYFLSGDKDTIINATDFPHTGFISKIDSLGNFIWMHVFNEIPHIRKGMWQHRLLPNGDIIISGNRYENVGSNIILGWLCKTDHFGNIKWEQYYKQNDSSGYNVLSEVKQMPDGGFIATGICKDTITKYQGIWLIRTDSNGCLVPGCFPTSVQVFPEEQMHISIYPNPTSGNFSIEYSKPVAEKSNVKVFDITGKIIYSHSEMAGVYKTQVKLKAAAGIYLLQIVSNKGERIYSQKIQVE